MITAAVKRSFLAPRMRPTGLGPVLASRLAASPLAIAGITETPVSEAVTLQDRAARDSFGNDENTTIDDRTLVTTMGRGITTGSGSQRALALKIPIPQML